MSLIASRPAGCRSAGSRWGTAGRRRSCTPTRGPHLDRLGEGVEAVPEFEDAAAPGAGRSTWASRSRKGLVGSWRHRRIVPPAPRSPGRVTSGHRVSFAGGCYIAAPTHLLSMARELAPTTLKRLRSALEEERIGSSPCSRSTSRSEKRRACRRLPPSGAPSLPAPKPGRWLSSSRRSSRSIRMRATCSARWSTPCAGWPIKPTGLVRYAGNRSQWRGWRPFPTPPCA